MRTISAQEITNTVALFSIALVLFVFIMVINVLLNAVLKGGNKDEK